MVTTHAGTHPAKHLYAGSGHWLAPCPVHVDQVPLRDGVWEQSISEGTQVVAPPFRRVLCPVSSFWDPFPSSFPAKNFGRTLPQEIIGPDDFGRLVDGKYRVQGGKRTLRGGDIVYEHIITLHGDDHYEDVLTVTSHADTLPIKHLYTGSGHWLARCPVS
jgi:hypothetical protein